MTLNERIGFEMRSRRLLKRMTLEEVAKGMGFASKNTVSRMELGKTMSGIDDTRFYRFITFLTRS